MINIVYDGGYSDGDGSSSEDLMGGNTAGDNSGNNDPLKDKTLKASKFLEKIKGTLSSFSEKSNRTQSTATPLIPGAPSLKPVPPVVASGSNHPMPEWELGKKEKKETLIKYGDLYKKFLFDIETKINYLESKMNITNDNTNLYKEMKKMLKMYEAQRKENIKEFKKGVVENIIKDEKYYKKIQKDINNNGMDALQLNAEIIKRVMKSHDKSTMKSIEIMKNILKNEIKEVVDSGKARKQYIEDLKKLNEPKNESSNKNNQRELSGSGEAREEYEYSQYGGGDENENNNKMKTLQHILEIFLEQLRGAQVDCDIGIMYGGRWFKMPEFNIKRLHELAALQRGRLFGYLLGFRSGFRPAEGNDVQQQLFHQAKIAGNVTPAEFNHYTQGFYPAYRIGRIHCTQGFPRRCFQILTNLR